MAVTKTYTGSSTRTLLPVKTDSIGVAGDVDSSIIQFKIPKTYDGWQKDIEWDCYITQNGVKVKPVYPLTQYDNFVVPGELTQDNGGKEIRYNLILTNTATGVVEKSNQASVYFGKSAQATVTPEPYKDYWTKLVTQAYIDSEFGIDTVEYRPYINFTTPNDSVEKLYLQVPYLNTITGKIDPHFFDPGMVVELFLIQSKAELITLTDASVPDLALITAGTDKNSLYLLTTEDATIEANWFLVQTDNPTFETVTATNITSTGVVNIADTNAVLTTDATGKIIPSVVSKIELGQLTGVASNVQTQINTEISARQGADTSLGARITAEETARGNADTTLQSNIDAEATSRQTADTTLQTNIDNEASARTLADNALGARIDTEISDRTSADTALGVRIDDEASTRLSNDNALGQRITIETTNRTVADATLQTNIDAETTARQTADTALQGNIDAEASTRLSADNALDANKISKNTPILAGTKTKITYDTMGLVTGGDVLSPSDIPDISATYQTKSNLTQNIVATSTVDTYPSAKAVYDTIGSATDMYIPLAGTNRITGNLIPSVNNSVDIGSSLKAYNNAYVNTQYIGNDVHVVNNASIGGEIVYGDEQLNLDAQRLYSDGNTITTRDGITVALSDIQYTGIIANRYNGVDDGALIYDKNGYARVGDISFVKDTAVTTPTDGHFIFFYYPGSSTQGQFYEIVPTSRYSLTNGVYHQDTAGVFLKIKSDFADMSAITDYYTINAVNAQKIATRADSVTANGIVAWDDADKTLITRILTSADIPDISATYVARNADISANTSNLLFTSYDSRGLVTGSVDQAYAKDITINGVASGLFTQSNVDVATIYAPITSGITGQFLKSSGGTPVWETVDLSVYELLSNKVSSFTSPTDTQYPSAKLVYDQLNTKQNTITGGASSITSLNLATNKALISDASGKVVVSGVTSTELGYMSGVTSSVQNQIDSKVDENTAITPNTSALQFTSYDAKGLTTGVIDTAYSKNISINGTSHGLFTQANSDVGSIYAPASAGTSGQYLMSTGGTPTWNNIPEKTTLTLNGVETLTPSWYAPIASGTTGQILQANSAGAPTWRTAPVEMVVVDNLITQSSTTALSANQGYVLNNTKVNYTDVLSSIDKTSSDKTYSTSFIEGRFATREFIENLYWNRSTATTATLSVSKPTTASTNYLEVTGTSTTFQTTPGITATRVVESEMELSSGNTINISLNASLSRDATIEYAIQIFGKATSTSTEVALSTQQAFGLKSYTGTSQYADVADIPKMSVMLDSIATGSTFDLSVGGSIRIAIWRRQISSANLTIRYLCGVQINSIDRYTITNYNISNSVINTSQIADGAITTSKIADLAVTKGKLSTDVQSTLDSSVLFTTQTLTDSQKSVARSNISAVESNTGITANASNYIFPSFDTKGLITGSVIQAYSKYATINGTSYYAFSKNDVQWPSFYAPITAGTTGQYLKSSGGTPDWADFPAIPTISLNNTVTTTPSFYAPITAGTSGYLLQSSGTGAPTWIPAPTGLTVIDNLATQSSTQPLSAKQGYVLDNKKVDIAQGTANAGKAMIVGSDGNLSPTDIPAGVVPTLNGVVTYTPSWYAPATAGTSGQILLSSGNGAPTWGNIDLSQYELLSNKVIAISSTSTDTQYPSAKLVYDQLQTKQATITGGATTITSSNLANNKALISSDTGKVAVSVVTSTELSALSGISSNVQTQLNSKVDENVAITAGTGTKITYDTKGLVTSSASLSAGDIPSLSATYIPQAGSSVITGTLTPSTTNSVTLGTTSKRWKEVDVVNANISGVIFAGATPSTGTSGQYLTSKGTSAPPEWQTIDLSAYQTKANLVTAWQTTTDDTHYPSENLVKTSLDGKVDENTAITANTANLNFPAYDTKGLTTGSVKTVYERAIYLNGAGTSIISGQYANDITMYAPATAGTSGQYLISSGTGAPTWATKSTSVASGDTALITSGAVYTSVNTKAPISHASSATTYGVGTATLYGHVKVDASATADSTNAIQSGAVYTALAGKQDTGDYATNTALTNGLATKAPTSHASTATTYGVGSATNYGHVKVDASATSGSANAVQSGAMYTALAGKQATGDYATNTALTNGLATKAPTSHASTATTYGVGTASNYGHVKVDASATSGSTNAVQSGAMYTALAGKQASGDYATNTALSSEASTRSSADTTLQNNINSEASTRASADTTLQTNINAKQASNLYFTDVSASFIASSTYTDYAYQASIALTGVTASDWASVTFGVTEATSGDYAPVSETYAGGVIIYSKANTAITIPSILIMKG